MLYSLNRTFVKLYRFIRAFVNKFIKIIFLYNTRQYYSRYLNSDLLVVTILKNLAAPKRLFLKIRYGCVKFLPDLFLAGEPKPLDYDSDLKVRDYVKKLKDEGLVVFESAHPELADYINKKYKHFFDSIKPSDQYENLVLNIFDDELSELIANPLYLTVMANYYNKRQPFLRGAPGIKCTYPNISRVPTKILLNERSKFNCDWHYDTVNMLQIHFLLHDLTDKDSHMLLAKNTHHHHRVNLTSQDYCYSDEYINDHYETKPIVGKKGTVYIWDSNAIHCANLIPNKKRSFIQALYSPGNDILTKIYGSKYGIRIKEKDLSKLKPISRNAFKFVAIDQAAEFKGMKDGEFTHVKYQSSEEGVSDY